MDRESWGNCKFEIDSANISSTGNTAKGYVESDLSRLLVIPLRLTGIMVKEDHKWMFQQQQFQFDIDFSFSLFATLILAAWILICIITLSVKTKKLVRVNEEPTVENLSDSGTSPFLKYPFFLYFCFFHST